MYKGRPREKESRYKTLIRYCKSSCHPEVGLNSASAAKIDVQMADIGIYSC